MPKDHKVFSLQLTDKQKLDKQIESYDSTKRNVSSVTVSKTPSSYSFLDASKKEHRAQLTMFNIEDKSNCFWCKHECNHLPIGCPIDYKHAKILKSYFSEITKDNYEIVGMISNNNIDEAIKQNMSVMNKSHFMVDGIFCSFNCCMAFINDNCHNMMYDQSKQLLYKMYEICFPDSPIDNKIIPAPHWRLLKSYGGHLTIDEFRNNFNQIKYVQTDITNKSISWIFREEVIF